MTISGLIFDLDGTITHTLPLCIAAFREAVEPLAGRAVSDEEIVATFGPSEEGTIRALAPHAYARGVADYLAAYERLMGPEHGPFPGAVEWLAELRSRGTRLALVTGKGPASAASTLRRFGLEEYFEHVGAGSPEGSVKTERIVGIVKKWGLAPREIAYVGDAPSDVEAARKAGVRMLCACWQPGGDEEAGRLALLGPDAVARTIDEARAWTRERLAAAPA